MKNPIEKLQGQVSALLINEKQWAVEYYLQHSARFKVSVLDGHIEEFKQSDELGIGCRVINADHQTGFACGNNPEALSELMISAKESARYNQADKYNYLPVKHNNISIISTLRKDIPTEDKIRFAQKIETIARNADRRITKIEDITYFDNYSQVAILNSNGLVSEMHFASYGGYAGVVAESGGVMQNGGGQDVRLSWEELSAERIALEAANEALSMLGGEKLKTQILDIIFPPTTGSEFWEVITSLFSADAVQKGKSLLAGKKNQLIATSEVTLLDDPLREGALGTLLYDAEGTPTQRLALVENGILRGFGHNTYTAAKAGCTSTGSAVRAGYQGTPGVGFHNVYLNPGSINPEEIIRTCSNGIIVKEILGMHTVNPISGEFSLGISGLLVNNGAIVGPVHGAAMAGNLLDLLNKITMIGNDARSFGSAGSALTVPTFVVKNIQVSGT